MLGNTDGLTHLNRGINTGVRMKYVSLNGRLQRFVFC